MIPYEIGKQLIDKIEKLADSVRKYIKENNE